jgi:multisubunit Na+/H+ antiporter MnhB subunit
MQTCLPAATILIINVSYNNQKMKKIVQPEIFLSLIIFVILLLIAFNTNTTGDAGDSVTHYLYSHYSLKYPHFFLHHWANPV